MVRGLGGEEPNQRPAQDRPSRQTNRNFAPVPHQLAAPPAPVKLFDVCCNNHWLTLSRSKEVPHVCFLFALLRHRQLGSELEQLERGNRLGMARRLVRIGHWALVNGASQVK